MAWQAGYLRAVQEMEAAAAQERARRDEHDELVAKRIQELEGQRLAAEAERQAAREQMQVLLLQCVFGACRHRGD